jgi:hypothetical protein
MIRTVPARDLVVTLIHRAIEHRFKEVGLCRYAKGWHVPRGLRPKDRLGFTNVDGTSSWVLATGERTFGGGTRKAKYRYHLVPSMRVLRGSQDPFLLWLRVHVHLTAADGSVIEGRRRNSRRKHLCSNWFNEEWLSRTLALSQLLWTEPGIIKAGAVEVSGWPLVLIAPNSIDDAAALTPDDATLAQAGGGIDAEDDTESDSE